MRKKSRVCADESYWWHGNPLCHAHCLTTGYFRRNVLFYFVFHNWNITVKHQAKIKTILEASGATVWDDVLGKDRQTLGSNLFGTLRHQGEPWFIVQSVERGLKFTNSNLEMEWSKFDYFYDFYSNRPCADVIVQMKHKTEALGQPSPLLHRTYLL